MPLTELKCKTAKSKEKPYKLSDAGGLYLEIMPNGSKYWRLKYRYLGKEKRLAIGVYPRTTLSEARNDRETAKKQLKAGVDPSAEKKRKKQGAILNAANTFEAVALEWHEKKMKVWTEKTGAKVLSYLKRDIFPYIGSRPIADIDPPELLSALRKIEARGAYFTAGRTRQICGQVFRYGVATGRNPRDPSYDLRDALTVGKTEHYKTLDIKEVPEFLRTLDRNDARLFPQTKRSVRLLLLTFVRTSELINATWDEIDFKNKVWEIPAERMKMKKAHIVPLSKQVIELFKKQKADTEHINTPMVFPNQVRPLTPMSNNTILSGIKRLGYKGRMTGHGVRSLAMTTLMEQLGYSFDIADAQLAHAKGNSVRRAYDRTKYIKQRTKMMQEWADYLDTITIEGEVVKGKFGMGRK